MLGAVWGWFGSAAPLRNVFRRLLEASQLRCRHRQCPGSAQDGEGRAAGKVGGRDGGGKDEGERAILGGFGAIWGAGFGRRWRTGPDFVSSLWILLWDELPWGRERRGV